MDKFCLLAHVKDCKAYDFMIQSNRFSELGQDSVSVASLLRKGKGIKMASMGSKVLSFGKKASSKSHQKHVVRTVTRSEIAELNKTIEPKIRQNERERTASMHAAARCTVGGK